MGKTKTNRDYTSQKTRKISNKQAKLSRKRIRKRTNKTESQRKEGNSKDQRQKKKKNKLENPSTEKGKEQRNEFFFSKIELLSLYTGSLRKDRGPQ